MLVICPCIVDDDGLQHAYLNQQDTKAWFILIAILVPALRHEHQSDTRIELITIPASQT